MANQSKPKTVFVSADYFHMVAGEYRFDPKNVPASHRACLEDYLDQLQRGDAEIVVDNTNTTLVELAPYVRLAEVYRREYKIMYLLCDVETAIKRNVHEVPANTILTMQRNLLTEIVPLYWNQEVCYFKPIS